MVHGSTESEWGKDKWHSYAGYGRRVRFVTQMTQMRPDFEIPASVIEGVCDGTRHHEEIFFFFFFDVTSVAMIDNFLTLLPYDTQGRPLVRVRFVACQPPYQDTARTYAA